MTSRLHRALFAACATMAAALALAQQAPGTPQTTTPAAAQPAQKTAADSRAADSATAAAAKAADAKKKADEQLLKDARNAGFKPEQVRGNLMFCRTAVEIGSNFPVRTCYNEDQVKIKIQEYQAQRQQLEGMHSSGMVTN